MGAREEKEALAVAARHAQGLIAQKEAEKATLMRKLAAVGDELSALQMVVKMYGDKSEKPVEFGPGSRPRVAQGEWPKRVAEVLHDKSFRLKDLHTELKTRFQFQHSLNTVKRLLETGERRGQFVMDEQRQWSNKVNSAQVSAQLGA